MLCDEAKKAWICAISYYPRHNDWSWCDFIMSFMFYFICLLVTCEFKGYLKCYDSFV